MISSITINNSYTVSISESALSMKILIFKHIKTPVSCGRMIKMLPLYKRQKILIKQNAAGRTLNEYDQPRYTYYIKKGQLLKISRYIIWLF